MIESDAPFYFLSALIHPQSGVDISVNSSSSSSSTSSKKFDYSNDNSSSQLKMSPSQLQRGGILKCLLLSDLPATTDVIIVKLIGCFLTHPKLFHLITALPSTDIPHNFHTTSPPSSSTSSSSSSTSSTSASKGCFQLKFGDDLHSMGGDGILPLDISNQSGTIHDDRSILVILSHLLLKHCNIIPDYVLNGNNNGSYHEKDIYIRLLYEFKQSHQVCREIVRILLTVISTQQVNSSNAIDALFTKENAASSTSSSTTSTSNSNLKESNDIHPTLSKKHSNLSQDVILQIPKVVNGLPLIHLITLLRKTFIILKHEIDVELGYNRPPMRFENNCSSLSSKLISEEFNHFHLSQWDYDFKNNVVINNNSSSVIKNKNNISSSNLDTSIKTSTIKSQKDDNITQLNNDDDNGLLNDDNMYDEEITIKSTMIAIRSQPHDLSLLFLRESMISLLKDGIGLIADIHDKLSELHGITLNDILSEEMSHYFEMKVLCKDLLMYGSNPLDFIMNSTTNSTTDSTSSSNSNNNQNNNVPKQHNATSSSINTTKRTSLGNKNHGDDENSFNNDEETLEMKSIMNDLNWILSALDNINIDNGDGMADDSVGTVLEESA